DELPNGGRERATRHTVKETIERKRARGQPSRYRAGHEPRGAEVNSCCGERDIGISYGAGRYAVAASAESKARRSCCGTATGNSVGCYPTVAGNKVRMSHCHWPYYPHNQHNDKSL